MICPHCCNETIHGMSIKALDTINWIRCSCGVIFQEKIECKDISDGYLEQYKQKKFYEDSASYPVSVYFPIIEEMTFGRRMLEVDSIDLEVSKAAAERGWITYATSQADAEKTHVMKKKFLDIKETPDVKFDLIFAYHYIEKLDSGDVLKKFRDWLNPGGVLFIATPDTHFVDEIGVVNFGHWFKENNILFSKSALKRELEKAMFEVVLVRGNPSSRFLKSNDMHVIARRGM